jgi:uncharacterized protein involved in cysteine biosynthesis
MMGKVKNSLGVLKESSIVMLIRAFLSAFYQLKDKSLRRVVCFGVIGSSVILINLALILSIILFKTEIFVFEGVFGFLNPVVKWIMDFLGITLIIVGAWLLFPPLSYLIVSLFLEDLALVIELKHYPDLPAPRNQSKWELLIVTSKFVTFSLILNILAFPVYAILFFLGPFNLVIYYVLNGYLIGREFFEIVAHRRLVPIQAKMLRQRFKWHLFSVGVIIVFLMTIPIVNFVAPVIAVAVMVYLVNGWGAVVKKI